MFDCGGDGTIEPWQDKPKGADLVTAYSCLVNLFAGAVVLTGLGLAGFAVYAWYQQGWTESIAWLLLWSGGIAAGGVGVHLLDKLLRHYI